ncbi:MAG: hypothetical protein AAFQ18_00080 [Pseudomonadota bacterium]
MNRFDLKSLKRMDVARAIAHPVDDLTRVSKQVLNMSQRNAWIEGEPDPTDGKGARLFSPADCVIAAVILRLWNAGFSDSATFDAAVDRLSLWRVTDIDPNWRPGQAEPEAPKNRPLFPVAFVLQDYCETGMGWSLTIEHRRRKLTGEFRTVAALHRGDDALGNGITERDGEVPQSVHVIVLDEILAQVAASTIYRKRAH